jgi:predicted lipid-binding transport protein (Tim44 family)
MSEGIPYADILIMALVAGFILLRLRSVLGDKIGNDNPSYFNKPVTPVAEKAEPIVQLDEKSLKAKMREEPDPYLAKADHDVVLVVDAIKNKDPQFTATAFLQGAKAAYEMLFDAFNRGDKSVLKMLLSERLYEEFSAEMAARNTDGGKSETTLVAVDAKDITEAELIGTIAHVTVHFVTEQVIVVRDAQGDIIEGDPSEIHAIEDKWTFERDVTSKNPNWKVIET